MKFKVIDMCLASKGELVSKEVRIDRLGNGQYIATLDQRDAVVVPAKEIFDQPIFDLWDLTNQLRRQKLLSPEGTVVALWNEASILSKSVTESYNDTEVRRMDAREFDKLESDFLNLYS